MTPEHETETPERPHDDVVDPVLAWVDEHVEPPLQPWQREQLTALLHARRPTGQADR